MATLKQVEANRHNALLSTGPKTPEGKAAVRLNALRHGLRAHAVVLPGENPEAFQQLCYDLEAEWQPQTRTEQLQKSRREQPLGKSATHLQCLDKGKITNQSQFSFMPFKTQEPEWLALLAAIRVAGLLIPSQHPLDIGL